LPPHFLATPRERAINPARSRWMRSLIFEGETWFAYEQLREKDKKLHKALCKLSKDMLRSDDPVSGLGKPEPLKHNLTGL